MLHAMNLCEDETLCNLSTYLSYQQFYDENSNTSPLVTELNDFIGNSSWYQYLTEILNRTIVYYSINS